MAQENERECDRDLESLVPAPTCSGFFASLSDRIRNRLARYYLSVSDRTMKNKAVFRRIGAEEKYASFAAEFVGVLFAVHPIHVGELSEGGNECVGRRVIDSLIMIMIIIMT